VDVVLFVIVQKINLFGVRDAEIFIGKFIV
jgi:hypothetical protein